MHPQLSPNERNAAMEVQDMYQNLMQKEGEEEPRPVMTLKLCKEVVLVCCLVSSTSRDNLIIPSSLPVLVRVCAATETV